MIYCVGPDGTQAIDEGDFLGAVKETGVNIFRAVALYNREPEKRVPIDFARVCLVSAHLAARPPPPSICQTNVS